MSDQCQHSITHMAGMLVGACAADALVGDPKNLPHPVNGIYYLAQDLRSVLFHEASHPELQRLAGVACVSACVLVSASVAGALARRTGVIGSALIIGSALAARSLWQAADEVNQALIVSHLRGDLTQARIALGQYVGRQTNELTNSQICSATIETLAENTNDAFITPLFWGCVGSLCGSAPAFIWGYKAISTLDSLYGYRALPHRYFGWGAARLDDVAAFIPARLTAVSTVIAAQLVGEDMRGAMRVVIEDHAKHQSPNAAWPESAFAGALHLKLNGPVPYQTGVVERPYLNEQGRSAMRPDIERAKRLSQATCAVAGVALIGTTLIVSLGLRLICKHSR